MAVRVDVILINDGKTLPSSTFWYHSEETVIILTNVFLIKWNKKH